MKQMVPHELTRDPLETFDWTKSETISEAVVTAVANIRETDPISLDPLYEKIDPDALDDLFLSVGEPVTPPTGSIRFSYAGHVVVINEHGLGYLYDRLDDRQSDETTNTQPISTSK